MECSVSEKLIKLCTYDCALSCTYVLIQWQIFKSCISLEFREFWSNSFELSDIFIRYRIFTGKKKTIIVFERKVQLRELPSITFHYCRCFICCVGLSVKIWIPVCYHGFKSSHWNPKVTILLFSFYYKILIMIKVDHFLTLLIIIVLTDIFCHIHTGLVH